MSNETPDDPQSTPADLTAGQHDLGAAFSSEQAAPVAVPESAPESIIPSAPARAYAEVPAYEAPGAAPAYPGTAQPYDPHEAVTVPQPGGHDFSTGGQGPAGSQSTNAYPAGYQAGGYPAGAYPVAAPAPKKPMSKGLLFGIIGGAAALVLLVAAVVIVPALLRGPAQTASGVVEEYLTALAEGDFDTALAYVEAYADDSLLNEEVLAASIERAPITDIVVEASDGDEFESVVSASFAIGGEAVERDFTVYKFGQDEWQLGDGLIAISLSSLEGLGLTINGVEPTGAITYVFPGTYQFSLAYEEFALDSDVDTFTLVTEDDADVVWDLQPVLTDDGAAMFRSLVRAAVEECVAMKTLTTPCGMDITDIDLQGYTAVDGSVTRTITAEGQKDLDAMEPASDYSTPSLVSTYDSVDIEMTLQGKKDGTTAEFDVWFGGYMNSPSVDFAAQTPTVIWE